MQLRGPLTKASESHCPTICKRARYGNEHPQIVGVYCSAGVHRAPFTASCMAAACLSTRSVGFEPRQLHLSSIAYAYGDVMESLEMAIQWVEAFGSGPYPETPFLPEIRSQVLAHLRWQEERLDSLAEPPQEEPEAPEETEPEEPEQPEEPAEEDLVWAPCLLLGGCKVILIATWQKKPSWRNRVWKK